MKAEGERQNDEDVRQDERPPPRPLQFPLTTALGIMTAVSLVFAVFRWLGGTPQAGYILLLVLLVSVVGAVALVVMISYAATEDDPP